MTDKLNRAERLANTMLELHIQHEMKQFETAAFTEWFESELQNQYAQFCQLKLKTLVPAKQVKAVIKRNVVDNDIPGAVMEIAGDAAAALFSSEIHRTTQLRDILSAKQYEEFVDKLLDLSEQRKHAIEHFIELPVYRDLISGVLYQAILRYIYEENMFSKHVPGVSSMLKFGKRMVDKTAPKFEDAVEDNVRSYIVNNLAFLLRESKAFLESSLTEEDIKVSALELWDVIESSRLGDFQEGMDSVDLSEFVVLGYEFWLRFRKSDYFKRAYTLVVDHFYSAYGNAPLSELLEDLGVDPERMIQEVKAFAPDVLSALHKNGQLEGLIRRRLEGFYTSEAALTCLSESPVIQSGS